MTKFIATLAVLLVSSSALWAASLTLEPQRQAADPRIGYWQAPIAEQQAVLDHIDTLGGFE